VASLPLELTDADRLRLQADTLQKRGFELIREGEDLKGEALELRNLADRIEREPVTVGPASPSLRVVDHDTEFMTRVCDALQAAREPVATGALAQHIGATAARVRTALTRLEATGVVVRSGIKRGTRWRLADEEPADDNVRVLTNYAGVVRDAAIKLDTFDMRTLMNELPDMSEATARKWVNTLVERGTLEKDGNVYAYVKPTATVTSRPKAPTPEAVARSMFSVRRARGGQVSGSGRGRRAGGHIVNALLREVRTVAPHVEVVQTAHKFSFRVDGREVATCSSTPGASSLKGSRESLIKAGIPVKPK
jgi:tRNA splicing endonuclease